MGWLFGLFAMLIAAVSSGEAVAAQAHLTGTVDYSDGMALPPGAVLEVVLEDVSEADAPARELGTRDDP